MLSVPLTSSLSDYISGSFLPVLVYAETEKADSSTPVERQIDDRDV